jgi:serine phosphatase RsbU (regulator of sigma subunit)
MIAAVLFALALLLVVRAWRAGRAADPARVPWLLVRLGVAAVPLALLLSAAGRASGAGRTMLVLAAGLSAIVVFDALVSLALWGPFRRRAIIVRAPFAAAAVLVALLHGPWVAVASLGALGLLSYRWRAALGTVALFRCALAAAALLVIMAVVPEARSIEGPLAPLVRFARIVLQMLEILTWVGVFKTFIAFTRDPSLGIRTVTRRLALSHVLVLVVPLGITVALWIATTFLGVNADRALAGQRLMAHELERLQIELTGAIDLDSGDGATLRLAAERDDRWPGTRLWLDRGAGLTRVYGDSIPGEQRLVAWMAGLDTLPGSGMVGLRGRRWVGAAARGVDNRGATAILLSPARGALDSTLATVLQASFAVREEDAGEGADSLSTGPDTLAAMLRDARAIRTGQVAARRRGRAGPRVGVTQVPRDQPVAVSVGAGADTIRSAESLVSSGMASLAGLEYRGGRWRRSDFMLTAHADPGRTLSGLFANVRDNPLQVVPIVMLALMALLLLPVAVLDFSMVNGMGRSIARAVGALRDGAAAVGRGELSHRIEIGGHDDLWEAARHFNRMAEGLERARELEKERARLEGELELARRIQRRLLPEAPPAVPGLEIAGHSEPAREVGGDYYDHFDLGGGRVLLVIADVSGKGVPAALLMSGFRASLMSQDAATLAPDRLAARVNEFLYRSVESGKFVTAFLGFLDAASGRLVYANAGHNPPALLRAGGAIEWLAAGGVVLGILPHARFESGEATLAPGDLLALYTDGVTEGQDATGEMWGEERLVDTLRRLRGLPCAEAVESLVREVRAFEGDTGPADDITVLLARRT